VRAATPLHPLTKIVDARTAAFYLPVRDEAWAGSRLIPVSAADWAGENSFVRAADAARASGLAAEAWVVLTHSSVLGTANPDLCVRNAAGEIYPYALCPSAADVREYAVRVATETVLLSGVTTVMVEACGPMGVGHLGHHEKTSGADWSSTDEALLSICFCAHCQAALKNLGADPVAVAAQVFAAIGQGYPSVEDALGGTAALVLEVRDTSRRALAEAVTAAARAAGATELLFHTQTDPWATGPFAALVDTPGVADGLIFPVSDLGLTGQPRTVPALADGVRVGGYVPLLPPADPDRFVQDSADALRGLDDLYLYHFGLLSRRRLDTVTELIAAL
jgi:hypothetical protein